MAGCSRTSSRNSFAVSSAQNLAAPASMPDCSFSYNNRRRDNDAYLTGLLDRLTAAQLEPRTLIIVVSDHGNRSKSSDAENYRVPMLVTGHGVRPLVDDTFRSHIDLEGIIAHYLVDTALLPNQERVFVEGSTERWVYGEIHETGDHLFIDDRSGRVLAHSGNLKPSKLYSDFQALLDEFGRRYGN